MTISAVYDFGSIRQHLAELVERKQAAVVGTAKPAESPFGWPVMGQQVLPPPAPPKPVESVYGAYLNAENVIWRRLAEQAARVPMPIGASRSYAVQNRDGSARAVTEVWDGAAWWLRNPNPSNSD